MHQLVNKKILIILHPHFGAASCGIPLQTGESRVPFPMVLVEFFIDIIVPAALRPSSRFSLWQKWGIRRPIGRADDRTTFLKSGRISLLEPSGSAQVCSGLAVPCIYFHSCFHSTTERHSLSSQRSPSVTVSRSADTATFMYKNERCQSPEVSNPRTFVQYCCATYCVYENVSLIFMDSLIVI